MSLKVGDDDEPLSKKQKGGQEEEAAADFPMMEDETTARSKLREAGFDPDASVDDFVEVDLSPTWRCRTTAMIYFCRKGDIRMCQYLLCLLYTSPSPRDVEESRMPSSA